jgi:hypothetical protein
MAGEARTVGEVAGLTGAHMVAVVMAATPLERATVMHPHKECDSSTGEGGSGDGSCMVAVIVEMKTG